MPARGLDAPMMKVDAVKRGTIGRSPLRYASSGAVRWKCNGNGLCFNFDARSPMCPSMKITQNRIHSPKGRATLVREWLRCWRIAALIHSNWNKNCLNRRQLRTLMPARAIAGMRIKANMTSHTKSKRRCRAVWPVACSTQCPIKIDVPEFRSRFLQLYHTRYLRPRATTSSLRSESYAPLMARAPKTFNFFINQPLVRKLGKTYRHG